MSTQGFLRGHPIEYREGRWVYVDTGEPTVETWRDRPCGHCGLHNTPEGHDGCLGVLPGVMSTCCGHGDAQRAYVQWPTRERVGGVEALEVINKLIKGRTMSERRIICNHCDATPGDCRCGGVWGDRVEEGGVASGPLIYLSGPMTGLLDFNYAAFDRAAAQLRALGFPVFNPTETFGRFSGLPKETYMAVDLAAVEVCGVVLLLTGWSVSEGAIREVQRALELGKKVELLSTFLERCEAGEMAHG